MTPGTKVWSHVGPTNTRLRLHLGLKVPKSNEKLFLKVVNDTIHWTEGKAFIFDDSFEHEVEHNAESIRMILIADFWHPDLDEKTINGLSPM